MKPRLLLCLTVWLALAACGEKPQTLGAAGKDQSPAEGVGASQYAVAGWKAGDQQSWQSHLRARAQYGQNEYSRAAQQ